MTLENLRQDVVYAFRALFKHPAFSAVVILTLALGIGMNTAIFSVIHAVILKPLPFREPERLVHIYEHSSRGARYQPGVNYISVRSGTFHDWKAQCQSCESIAAYYWRNVTLTGGDRAELYWSQQVTEGFFETLGVPAALGRTFTADDYRPDAPRVAILAHGLWKTRFGGDPQILGRTIPLDQAATTVVGVMPPGFYPTWFDPPGLWTPLWFNAEQQNDRVTWGLIPFVRLRPGITLEQAASEMDVISERIGRAQKQTSPMGAVVAPAQRDLTGDYEKLFYFLFVAVGLVLLIACVNVAAMILSRSVERQKELALRSALGASRVRLGQQVLTESILLASVGGALGLALTRVSIAPIVGLLPANSRVPRLDEVQVDTAVLLFTLAVSVLAGVLFGMIPGIRASRMDPNEVLKGSGRGATSSWATRRWSDALVIAEVSLCVVLLAGAGLLLASFLHVQNINPGFSTDRMLALQLRVPDYRYGEYKAGESNEGRVRLYRELSERITALPGVEAAATSNYLPLRHGVNPWSIHVVGRPALPEGADSGDAADPVQTQWPRHGSAAVQRVSAGYFRTLGVALIAGRYLDERDDANAPGATVINETFARKYFSGEDPVGKTIVVNMTSYFPRLQVVGVVADFKLNALDKDPYPETFWSDQQYPGRYCWLIVRTKGDARAMVATVQQEIAAFDRELPIEATSTMDAVAGDSIWRYRFSLVLLGLFAAFALALAATGVYSVMAHSVSRRTQEMGIRLAVGARPRTLLIMVVWQGLRLVLMGATIGIAISVALQRVIAGLTFGVTMLDPLILAGVVTVLAVTALLACYIPARRASSIDPLAALRHE